MSSGLGVEASFFAFKALAFLVWVSLIYVEMSPVLLCCLLLNLILLLVGLLWPALVSSFD